MHARSISFHGRPANIDAGVAFVKNEAWPALDQIQGCRGLSFLVDRESGRCIATSSWDTEAAMLASDDTLRPVRDRGRDVLGGSMQVDEWEVVAMHRTHHGACCRVTWTQGDVGRLTDTFKFAILPRLEQTRGFCSASVLVNRASGLACTTTCWETPAAMEASRSAAADLHRRAAADTGGEVVEVHEFELAYAHLHVPHMA